MDENFPVKFFSARGELVSTATDYMIFSQKMLNKGAYNGVIGVNGLKN